VILHTNDTHSNIEPFSSAHPKFPNLGGVAKRATLINQIRSEEANVLLLDAGDIFQGTPYFNKYKGVLEMKVMNEMKYDVVTLGNHDFDIGISGYVQAKKHAAFKVVNCNYQLDKTALKELVTPHTVIKRGGLKIGIVGVGIDLNGLIANDVAQQITYLDPIDAVQKEVTLLRSKGCDYIICLSHLGFDYPNEKDRLELINDIIKIFPISNDIDLPVNQDSHPTPLAHKIIAEAIIKKIEQYEQPTIHAV
jgi:5'-nucleotidase